MLEQIIAQHLKEDVSLATCLSTYNGEPAIFNRARPLLEDPGWGNAPEKNYVVLFLDFREDAARRATSTLKVEIICSNIQQPTEDIGQLIKDKLKGCFFTENKLTISADWIKAESLEPGGIRLIFSVNKFSCQDGDQNNPAMILKDWCRGILPSTEGETPYFLGDADMPPIIRPTASRPALYFRISKVKPCDWIKGNSMVDWRTAIVQGHIIVPDNPSRETQIALYLDEAMAAVNRIVTETSTMEVNRNTVIDLTAAPQRIGQLAIEATYGIAKAQEPGEKLQNVSVKIR